MPLSLRGRSRKIEKLQKLKINRLKKKIIIIIKIAFSSLYLVLINEYGVRAGMMG